MDKKANWVRREEIIKTETELYDCPVCKGKGTTGEGVFKKLCPTCHGDGKLRR